MSGRSLTMTDAEIWLVHDAQPAGPGWCDRSRRAIACEAERRLLEKLRVVPVERLVEVAIVAFERAKGDVTVLTTKNGFTRVCVEAVRAELLAALEEP